MSINLRKTILSLTCIFAFLASFDQVLELYGIDTIFKPSRVAAIFILIVSFFYQYPRWKIIYFQPDKCWIFMIIWGITMTLLKFFLGIKISLFNLFNDGSQVLFLIFVYLAIKRIEMTTREMLRVFAYYAIGVCLNNALVILNYYILQTSSRAEGLMENSNWAAFSIGIAILYFIFRLSENRFSLWKASTWFYMTLVIYLIMGVIATGSRTGVFVTGLCIPLMALLSADIGTKFRGLVFMVIVFPFMLMFSPVREFIANNIYATLTENSAVGRLKNTSDDIRLYLWRAGWNSVEDNFGTGLGIGQFRSISNYKKYMLPVGPDFYYGREVRDTNGGIGLHSLYIQILVDYGVVPLLALLFFFYKVLIMRIVDLFTSNEKATSYMSFVIMVAVLLTSITGQGLMGGVFWVVMLIISHVPPRHEKISA